MPEVVSVQRLLSVREDLEVPADSIPVAGAVEVLRVDAAAARAWDEQVELALAPRGLNNRLDERLRRRQPVYSIAR